MAYRRIEKDEYYELKQGETGVVLKSNGTFDVTSYDTNDYVKATKYNSTSTTVTIAANHTAVKARGINQADGKQLENSGSYDLGVSTSGTTVTITHDKVSDETTNFHALFTLTIKPTTPTYDNDVASTAAENTVLPAGSVVEAGSATGNYVSFYVQ